MPRLYREAPLNSIWEGSGNVIALDVLRALAREPGRARGVPRRGRRGRRRRRRASTRSPRRLRAELADPDDARARARAASSSAWRSRCRARCSCATPRPRSPTRSAPRASTATGGLRLRHAARRRRRRRDRRAPHARGLTAARPARPPRARPRRATMCAPMGGGSIQLARVFGIRIGVEPELVLRPVPDDLLAVGLLRRRRSTGSERHGVRRSRSPARCCSSSRSSCTSSATRSSRGATGSGSSASTCGSSAASRSSTRDADSPGEEFRDRRRRAGRHAADRRRVCAGAASRSRARRLRRRRRRSRDDQRHARRWRCSAGWRSINVVAVRLQPVPAFPLDGGRIARAIAWKVTGDRNRGTRFSARARPGLRATCSSGFGVYVRAPRRRGRRHLVRRSSGWFLGQAARGAVVSSARSPSASRASRSPTSWTPSPSRCPARRTRRSAPRTSSSCATAGRGSRSSTRAGRFLGVAAPGARSTARSTAASRRCTGRRGPRRPTRTPCGVAADDAARGAARLRAAARASAR